MFLRGLLVGWGLLGKSTCSALGVARLYHRSSLLFSSPSIVPTSESRRIGTPAYLSNRNRHDGEYEGDEASQLDHRRTAQGRWDVLSTMEAQGLSPTHRERIMANLKRAGLWDEEDEEDRIDDENEDNDDGTSPSSLMLLAQDFVDRPEVFSSLLITDFGFPPLVAHQTRALAMALIRRRGGGAEETGRTGRTIRGSADGANGDAGTNNNPADGKEVGPATILPTVPLNGHGANHEGAEGGNGDLRPPNADTTHRYSNKAFHDTIVNERAKKRKTTMKDGYSYGLPNDYAVHHPQLGSELDDFYKFMTQPSTYSQEDPIRPATAKVYLLHAKLFLGWCIDHDGNGENHNPDRNPTSSIRRQPNGTASDISLFEIVPDKERESADQIIAFILWLRSRDVSVSYEANLLRGIIKLLKFRFARTSKSDPMSGKNTFDDIPVIKEVRKLHRDANRRQRLSPRSSDEQKKWISWPEYLRVIQCCKQEALDLRDRFLALDPSKLKYAKGDMERRYSLEQQRVAEAYQRYLILAIFASIPDRQRTIRELEVGRTLVKDRETGLWNVKHGPDDYKTGKHYGERPAMQLAEELVPAIDDFLENFRPALLPSTNFLLVQSKTGKPMTSDSIFQRVTRSCFKWTGKSTNPHMLRDIIVTHVRETDASEKELEALALFMGHSISMQRDSYDRRTLTTKIAPAVKLMRSVNKMAE